MSVSLSIKNVPDDLAERLRTRAARNRRSLQRELMLILERAAASGEVAVPGEPGSERVAERMSFDEIAGRARVLFPKGTPSSVASIREMRDGRARELDRRMATPRRRRSR
jgi:plasmid stability protein